MFQLRAVCLRLAATAAIGASLTAQASPPLLQAPRSFDTGGFPFGIFPYQVAAGNLNGDAFPDLVVSNAGGNSVAVLIGEGDGTFGAATSYVVSSTLVGGGILGPAGVAIGDLDDDGANDVAVAHNEDGNLIVLFGVGNGELTSETVYSIGPWPVDVVMTDMNLDGHLDVVVAQLAAGSLGVLLNVGNGALAPPVDYPVSGSWPVHLAIGFVNQDSIPDAVVTNVAFQAESICVLLGQPGPALLGPATHYPFADTPQSVALADFDGDGLLDIAAALAAGFETAGSAAVLLNQGGAFGPPTYYPAGLSPYWITVADLDLDSAQDLVLANNESNTLSVFMGHGDGSFEPQSEYPAGFSPFSLVSLDCNQDGHLDVIAVLQDSVAAILGNGDGSLVTVAQVPVGEDPRSVIAADLDEDGQLDLVVANRGSDTVSVAKGDGSGSFGSPVEFVVGVRPTALLSADFNHDGHLDIATANEGSNNITLLAGSGDGTLGLPAGIAVGLAPQAIAIGRLDADDVEDLVVANGGSKTISVLLGKTGHGFEAPVHHPVGSWPFLVALADMDADGWLDVVVSKGGNTIAILLNQGDGTLGPLTNSVVDGAPRGLAVGYLNGDKFPDVAVANDTLDSVTLFLGQGNGVLGGAVHVPVGEIPKEVVMGDLDGDGHTDVGVSCLSAGVVSVLLGDGDGGLAPAIDYSMPNSCWGLGLADVNDDARLDVLVASSIRDYASAVLNIGGSPIASWEDLGFGLAGTSGTPILSGIGSLVPGSHGALKLDHAAPLAPAVLFVSLASTPTPFKCGSLVPMPVLGQFLLHSSATGSVWLGWKSWPAALSGLNLFFQYAVVDATGPCGVTLSNALLARG